MPTDTRQYRVPAGQMHWKVASVPARRFAAMDAPTDHLTDRVRAHVKIPLFGSGKAVSHAGKYMRAGRYRRMRAVMSAKRRTRTDTTHARSFTNLFLNTCPVCSSFAFANDIATVSMSDQK